VLVVDDDPLTRTMMSRLLTRLGCTVSTAENGEIALEMVLSGYSGRFAVVFLDNQMPVMSGLSMVTKLRKAGRKDFVVGVTGNALLSDQEEYLEAGVDRCVFYFYLCHFPRLERMS
jgi:osomolarity two-component system, sensor histidine kinase SLN1